MMKEVGGIKKGESFKGKGGRKRKEEKSRRKNRAVQKGLHLSAVTKKTRVGRKGSVDRNMVRGGVYTACP